VRRTAFVLAAAIAVVLASASGAAAKARINGVDVRGFPLVGLTVSTDSSTPLTHSNVRVVESGVPVTVTKVMPLSGSTTGVDVVLVIDVSDSMRGRELNTALEAARAFVAAVPDWMRIGVVTFAQEPTVVSQVTSDRASVEATVDGLSATTSRGTALYQAVSTGAGLFEGNAQHNVVVLTDGRNTESGTVDGAATEAKQAHASVFAFGLEGGDPDQEVLQELAKKTGGEYELLASDDLMAAYQALAVQLSHQYVIEYRSKVPYGAQARIEIDVPGGTDEVSQVMPAPPVTTIFPAKSLLDRLFDTTFGMLLVVGLAFVAALLFMGTVTNLVSTARRRRELTARMIAGGPEASPVVEDSATTPLVPRPLAEAVERSAEAAGLLAPIARLLQRAGWKVSPGEFLLPSVLAPVFVGALVAVLLNPIIGAVLTVVLLLIPFFILSRAARARLAELQSQLSDVLMILAGSLRAGHSFLQALDSVAKEIEEPAASEFSRALAEVQLGSTIDDALERLAERIGSQDLDWAVTAIAIQRKVGGNLAEVLETVAATIRERETMRRQVRVLSAEGRWSVIILVCLPFVIIGYLLLVNPSYLAPLWQSPVGRLAIGGAGLLMIGGTIWMRKIVRLDA
jgi:tight adherence protein B